jgi:hypothetical protein
MLDWVDSVFLHIVVLFYEAKTFLCCNVQLKEPPDLVMVRSRWRHGHDRGSLGVSGLGIGAIVGVDLAVVLLFGSSPSKVDSISVRLGNECSDTVFSLCMSSSFAVLSCTGYRSRVACEYIVVDRAVALRAAVFGARQWNEQRTGNERATNGQRTGNEWATGE